VSRSQIPLDKAIKTIGLFPVAIVLHPEVRVHVTINVARTEDEAERQARGEDVLAERAPEEESQQAPAELFEEGAGPAAEEEAAT
jgi:large subunit ribosomal protein L9